MPDYPSGPPGPERGMRHAESNTSQVTACHRCRKQKLRCSREIPSCKRCQDISANCSYPPPPDRKLLAAQRAQNAKARSLQESRNTAAQRDFVGAEPSSTLTDQSPTDVASSQLPKVSRTNYDRRSLSGESQVFPLAPMTLLQVAFPPEELALALIDIYFSHQYNSTLLFHKQTLVRDYLAGTVPEYVALSVFALGAVFLAVSTGQNLDASHPIAGSQRPGEEWATAASQKALMYCDQPRYEVVQACQTLAMYWFAVGQTDRTNMHHHIAYRTCRLLGYNKPIDFASTDAFSAELRRRAFWASWSMGCLSQNNASFKTESWREAIGLPLPCDEASFATRQPMLKEAFDIEGHLTLLNDQPELARISYMGEIVKLLSLWWEISTFAKRFVDAGPLDSLKRMSQLQDFDQQLDTVRENLHPSFQYKDITSFSSRETSHNYQLFAVRVLYHLCVCTLHSSIVPVFSNIPPDARISRKLTRMSATEAVRHSQALIGLATDLLGVHSDKSRCPSFTGYAMFMAVSIQFKSLGAQGLLRGGCIGSLYPAISILECLKGVWRTQEALWKILESLFSGADLNINNLSDTRQLLALPDRNLDLDEIASHGVMQGSADIYTYVADEEPRSRPSRQASLGVLRGNSPREQRPASFRRPPATKTKLEENYRPTLAGSASPHVRVLAEHHNSHIFWPGGQMQIHDADQGGNSSQHDRMISPDTPFQFRPVNSSDQNGQNSETSSGPSFQTQAPEMGYMGVDISMGINNMDLDTSGGNLWWDQPFEAIPAHQYGWWQTGGYEGPSGDTFYTNYGDK